ncbi:MAG: DUF4147 domain-containing protein [Actinobacteria bacterium]|nr:DUF4147 domain-containing protein [Actinomycetota bacterium]
MFEPIVLSGGPDVAARLLDVLRGAIEAVDPRRAVRNALGREAGMLLVGGQPVSLPRHGITVLALGKAAVAMAWGAADALEGIPVIGVAATPDPGPAPPGIEVVEGAHPSPDRRSVAAGATLMAAAGAAGPEDLVLVLISGGGSACAEAPAPGLDIEHLAGITDALLASGAPIEEINIVRRGLSLLKGGGLAAAAAPARVVTLILSDVVGNDLPTIAGGPTVPNPTGTAEALTVIEDRRLAGAAGPAVLAHLRKGSSMTAPSAGPIVVVADAATAAEGARAAAARLGIPAAVVDTRVTGEARLAGRRLADLARGPGPLMSILAGETTVAVTGSGSGGRNQEVALAAAIALDGCDGSVVASLGTDGVDGPTRAAGGVADGSTLARGRTAGLDAVAALDANDSGSYLAVVGSRLVSGPTGTNVGDVMVAWRR